MKKKLEAEAPTHFETPAGSHIALDYAAEQGPTLSVRVQELYGLSAHPALAGGRVPLTLELLSRHIGRYRLRAIYRAFGAAPGLP